jgi:protein tyrosine phosphatase (PTP) superfamily phosphohydrolase (DUF442 family)
VTVYCRWGAQYLEETPPAEYKGVRLLYTPYLHQREFETLSHELRSILDSAHRPFDLYCFPSTRSAPFYVPVRGTRRIVVVNTDGLEGSDAGRDSSRPVLSASW